MAGTNLAAGYWRNVGIAAGVALVGVAIIHLIAQALGVSMIADTPAGTQEVPLVIAAVQAVVFTVIGAGFGWVMARFSESPGRIWLIAAIIVLVAQGANAFIAADDIATGVVLNIEHLAVFAPSLVWVYPALKAGDA